MTDHASDPKQAQNAHVESSIQVALDAADAAMDVTTEFARIKNEFVKTQKSVARIHRTGLISVVCGVGVSLVVTGIIGFLFAASMTDLKNLTRSNVELLTLMVEKVRDLTANGEKIEQAAQEARNVTATIKTLNSDVVSLNAEVKLTGEKIDALGSQVDGSVTGIATLVGDQPIPNQFAGLGDRISMANAEFTQMMIDKMDARIAEQNEVMVSAMADMAKVLDNIAAKSEADEAALEKVRQSLQSIQARNAVLVRQLAEAKRRAEEAKKAAAPAARDNDVIRFPRAN